MRKKILALCLILMLLAAASALASDLEVLSERMYVIAQVDTPRIYYFRVVRNNGAKALSLPVLEIDILDRNGSVMGHDRVYSSRYTLNPGQVACYAGSYLLIDSLKDLIDQGRYPGGFQATCDAEPTDYSDDAPRLPASCSWDMRRLDSDRYYIDVTFENYIHATLDMDKAEIYLFDEDGHIVLAGYDFLFTRVPGYQTQKFRFYFEAPLMRAVLENNPDIRGVYSQIYAE